MNNAVAERTAAPMIEIRDQLEARANEFSNALPSHIRPAHFQRTALTAIQNNPKLLTVDRRSLINALMKCAGDGLLPDGRQAVLVIYKDRERGPIAQYQPMVAGIRLLVQQSGEITRFDQYVVFENDHFHYELGDHPKITHVPAITDRGNPDKVYSVAQYRDGTISREVMHFEEIQKIRNVSRTKDDGPWRDWWEEMARKTVAKRHAKRLPMSNDTAAILARDDAEHTLFPAAATSAPQLPGKGRPRLADQLDALSPPPGADSAQAEKRKRGRPRTAAAPSIDRDVYIPDPDNPDAGSFNDAGERMPAFDKSPPIADPDQSDIEDFTGEPGDEKPPRKTDYDIGAADAEAGRRACLDADIRNDAARLYEWQLGYQSVKKAK